MAEPEHLEVTEVSEEALLEGLLGRVLAGDSGSREALFQQLRTYLLFVARDHVDPHLQGKFGPSDIVQQSMMKAVEELPHFRGTTAVEFKGWLRQILVNEANMARRTFAAAKRDIRREVALEPADATSAALRVLDPIDEHPTPRANALAREQADRVRGLMDQLPENYRQVVRMRNWEELSFEEIAARMNMSTSGVAKIWYRALIEVQRLYQLQNESRTTES
jgi:RNA polymerase sigma-70 factor, ECF subfamily